MKVQVIGSGCQKCMRLFELTQKAVSELNLNVEVEHISDVTKLVELGIMSSPAIVVDDIPVFIGSTDNIEKVKELITTKQVDNCCKDNNCDCECNCEKSCC